MELTVILGDVGFKSQLKIYIILKQILSVCSHRHLPIWFLQTNTELFFFGWWRWGRGTLLPLADSFYRIILQMQSCVRGVGVNKLNNPSVPAWESNNRCVVVAYNNFGKQSRRISSRRRRRKITSIIVIVATIPR